MDMITLDVTDIPDVATGDEVVIIGKTTAPSGAPPEAVGGEKYFSAEELAAAADTINYEIVTRINSYIPRRYV